MAYFTPTISLAKLNKRTSRRGEPYFLGRLGAANVVLVNTGEVSESGQEIWALRVSEPAPKPATLPSRARTAGGGTI
jgi:hypothetical protein